MKISKNKKLLIRLLLFLKKRKHDYKKYEYKHESFFWIIKIINSIEEPQQLDCCFNLINLYRLKDDKSISHLKYLFNQKQNELKLKFIDYDW